MPARDKTGPMGQGPLTGGGRGGCGTPRVNTTTNENDVDFTPNVAPGSRMYLRRGRCFGGGRGRGLQGAGWRGRGYGPGMGRGRFGR